MKNFLLNIWNNKFLRFVIIAMALLVLIALVITVAIRPRDNYQLSADEKRLQSDIQHSIDRSDARISEVMVQDGNWSLVRINSTDDRGNFTMVIMDGDQLALGPASDFPIEGLVEQSIPDAIINYLYPERPQWVYFGDDFNAYFPYSQGQVKFVITAFAQQQSIDLNRVIMLDDGNVTQHVDDPRGVNRTETTEFKFTINHDSAAYTFRSIYTANNSAVIYSILDSDGKVLYSQQTSA